MLHCVFENRSNSEHILGGCNTPIENVEAGRVAANQGPASRHLLDDIQIEDLLRYPRMNNAQLRGK
jgi:hypothetical protein